MGLGNFSVQLQIYADIFQRERETCSMYFLFMVCFLQFFSLLFLLCTNHFCTFCKGNSLCNNIATLG